MKKALTVLFISLLLASSLFAVLPSQLQFSYKLRRIVPEEILSYWFSSDAVGQNTITTKELNTALTLSDPQFYISGTTDWLSTYSIVLSFTKMVLTSNSSIKCSYNARIFTNPGDSTEYSDVVFAEGMDEAQAAFRGGNTATIGEEAFFSYPVSFAFGELPPGTYTGTVRLEVVPE